LIAPSPNNLKVLAVNFPTFVCAIRVMLITFRLALDAGRNRWRFPAGGLIATKALLEAFQNRLINDPAWYGGPFVSSVFSDSLDKKR
jgi:hypothetical protein